MSVKRTLAYGKKATEAERSGKSARESRSNKPDGQPPGGRYIGFSSDFGFKYLPGQPGCEGRFWKCLSDVPKEYVEIVEIAALQELNTKQPGVNAQQRKLVFAI